MDAKELLRGQFRTMHQFMDMTIGDCTPEVMEKKEPDWTINKIGALYAHVYLAEDTMLNTMRGGTPILQRDGWSEKLGITDASPRQDEHMADIKVDLPMFQEYAKAVAASTDEFLANATDEELQQEIDGPVGKQPFITFVSNIGLTHVAGHWGEIAALKGVQGLKGLPF